jgi:type III secretion protein T
MPETAPDWLSAIFANTMVLAVGATRIAAAFMLLPLLSPETVPPLVRNSIFLAFGKEALIGVVIGFFFGTMLWAFEAAGQIIDAKVGATMAQIVDPLSGHQTSLNGEFLARLANFVFMFSGGLLLLVGTILDSYAIWPIGSLTPVLSLRSLALFEGEFSRLMVLAVMLATPALAILYLVDGGLGLINRYAPQLNVFALGLAIKSWIATAVILAMLTGLVQLLLNEIGARPSTVLQVLKAMSGKPL